MATMMRPLRLPRQAGLLISPSTRCASSRSHTPPKKQQPRQPRPSYQLNEITADLDNPDVTGVRVYDGKDEEDWDSFWVDKPRQQEEEKERDRTAKMKRDIDRYMGTLADIKTNTLSPWRLTEHDIFSFCLLGPPASEKIPEAGEATEQDIQHGTQQQDTAKDNTPAVPTVNATGNNAPDVNPDPFSPHSVLRRSLNGNGIIFSRMYKESETLKFMVAHRDSYNMAMPELAVSTLASSSKFSDIAEWRRFTANIIQSPALLDALPICETNIVRYCASNSGELSTDREALEFLNNLAINLERREKRVPCQICFIGLVLSARMASIPSAERFMQLGAKEGYFSSEPENSTPISDKQDLVGGVERALRSPQDVLDYVLSLFLSLVKSPTSFPLENQSSTGILWRIMALLTGRRLVGPDVQPSLRGLIGASPEYFSAYAQYIMLLGELGAYKLLWHEWRESGPPTPPAPLPQISGEHGVYGLKSKLFALALFRVPGAPSPRWKSTTKVGPQLGDEPRWTKEPDYWGDCFYEVGRIKSNKYAFVYGSDDGPRKSYKNLVNSGGLAALTDTVLSDVHIQQLEEILDLQWEEAEAEMLFFFNTVAVKKGGLDAGNV